MLEGEDAEGGGFHPAGVPAIHAQPRQGGVDGIQAVFRLASRTLT